MKGLVLFVLASVTLYTAGIYRSQIVMTMAVIEFLLWIFMAVLAHFFSKKLKAVSWGNEGRCVRGEKVGISLQVENRGWLPIWYFRAGIRRYTMNPDRNRTSPNRMDRNRTGRNHASQNRIDRKHASQDYTSQNRMDRKHASQDHTSPNHMSQNGTSPDRYTRKNHTERLTCDGQVNAHSREMCRFEILPEHCGVERFAVDRIWVWDVLKLFKKKIKLEEGTVREKLVAVFPREYVMEIEASEGESLFTVGNDVNPIPLAGEDVHEILQYNAYAPGDSFKNIHWKLSARSEEIWVKKFSKADEHRVSLFANLLEDAETGDGNTAGKIAGGNTAVGNTAGNTAAGNATAGILNDALKDAFYEILQALMLGLLAGFDSVDLYWFDSVSGEMQSRVIRDRAGIDEAFLALYQAGWMQKGQIDEKAFAQEKRQRLGNQLIELDGQLRLFGGGLLVRRFSVEHYVEELQAGKVVIP